MFLASSFFMVPTLQEGLGDPQDCSKRPKTSPRPPHASPRGLQDGPSEASGGAWPAPKPAKKAPICCRETQDGPRAVECSVLNPNMASRRLKKPCSLSDSSSPDSFKGEKGEGAGERVRGTRFEEEGKGGEGGRHFWIRV